MEKEPMKKQMYSIIGLGAAVAVLGGGLIMLKVTDKSGNDSSSSSVAEETNTGADLVLIEDGDKLPGTHTLEEEHYHGVVKNVKIVNKNGEMEVVLKKAATDDTSAVYGIKGCDDLPMNETSVNTLAYTIDNLTSTSLIEENCTDLDKFGLGSGAPTVELSYESGIQRKLYIGNVSPVSNQTYVRVDGSDSVFTIQNSSAETYLKKPEDFVKLTLLEEPPQDQTPKVNSLRIQREDIDYDIYIEYDNSTEKKNSGGSSSAHKLVEPTVAMLTVEKSTPITNGMFGLTAESVQSIHSTDKDKAEAGLDKPFCTVTMKCDDGKDYVLLSGKPFTEDGKEYCYIMFKDANVIYKATTENAQWAKVMPIDIASRLMFSGFVWNISELEAKAGSTTEKFEISMKDSSKATSDATTDDVIVKRNSGDFGAERYRQFYAFLISLNAEDFALGEKPSGEPMASVTIKDSLQGTVKKYEFYDYSVMKSLVVIDGESKFFCSKANADALVENIGKITTGQDFTEKT